MRSRQEPTRPGFTLIELLVVIAIIAVLIALLLPAVQRVREASFRVECGNNLKQIGIALSNYHDTQKTFPSGFVTQLPAGPSVTSPGWGWAFLILPFIEQDNLFQAINSTLLIEDPSNAPYISTVLKTYVCPSDRHTGQFMVLDDFGNPLVLAATNSYAGSFGTTEVEVAVDNGDGMFYRNSQLRYKDVTDGTAYTLAIGERGALLTQCPWAGAINFGTCRISPGAPTTSNGVEDPMTMPLANTGAWTMNDPNANADAFCTPHRDTALWLYVDGSVRPMKKEIEMNIIHALTTRAGGEPAPPADPI
jgi:prepilin-type N-terminal cleavage/methylation domain-containing protein